jgi:hypothetical protein
LNAEKLDVVIGQNKKREKDGAELHPKAVF